MNQILVCEKIYVTPELKRKKKIYKFYFVFSIILIVLLISYYAYATNIRNIADKSKEILGKIRVVQPELKDDTVKIDDEGLVVVLSEEPEIDNTQEIKLEELEKASQNASGRLVTEQYATNSGVKYNTVAVVEIPKINITYPIIYSDDTSAKAIEDLLKISLVKYWGPDANKKGNFCVVGHNYHNKKFFSKLSTLEVGDTIYLTDTNNNTLEYKVYDNYIVDPDNLKCTSQLTNGQTEITLITCTITGKQRTVIKARAVN